MKTIHERLRWARKRAGFDSGTEAATAFGWKISTYLGHENGDRRPSRDKAKQYARSFRVRWTWILENEGSPTAASSMVPLVGYVGAGEEVVPLGEDSNRNGIDEIELPAADDDDLAAVEVRGRSMYPRYFEGEKLIYGKSDHPPSALIGKECVVRLHDGRMLVKILRRGTKKGHFNLESWNAPLMEDQIIDWAAPVRWRV